MLSRLKAAFVSSFVGAIALGWAFAQAISHAVSIIATPIASWISRWEYRGMSANQSAPTAFFIQDAIPELIRTVALLLVGYALLRWLYYDPVKNDGVSRNSPVSD
jgi:hypothetical protein